MDVHQIKKKSYFRTIGFKTVSLMTWGVGEGGASPPFVCVQTLIGVYNYKYFKGLYLELVEIHRVTLCSIKSNKIFVFIFDMK